MKKQTKAIIAVVLVLVLVVGGVLFFKNRKKSGNTEQLNVCLASEPKSIDPARNTTVDGATLISHMFSGLAKWEQKDGKLQIVPDVAKELPKGEKTADGKITYTYKLDKNSKWSDGTPVTAKDFVYAWNRAASVALAADYAYMFEIVDGYEKMWEMNDNGTPDNPKDDKPVNPDAKLNIEAPDDETFKVTLTTDVPYWNEFLAFPSFFPVKESAVQNENWATDPATYVCNGAYKLASWTHDSLITLTKNDNHPNAKNVTMKTLNFYLSDKSDNMLNNFKNKTWQFIDDVPTNEIKNLKKNNGDEFKVVGQLGTYYINWNMNFNLLPADSALKGVEKAKAESEIRRALSLLLDRTNICDNIAQAGQVPASSFIAMGLTNPDGTEFYQTAGDKAKNGYVGYYDASKEAVEGNFNKAVEMLKKYYKYDEASKKFTNFPTITYLYNTSDAHKAIAEYVQSALGNVGIKVNLENQEWATFVATRKKGDFTLARNGWLGDYNDPISFLDLWVSVSGNNDVQFGKGEKAGLKAYNLDLTPFGIDKKVENGTWAETYDVLISEIKKSDNAEIRNKMMHLAEDMIMDTGCITPLYYYTDIYMLDKNVEGFFSSPLGYKFFMYCTVKK